VVRKLNRSGRFQAGAATALLLGLSCSAANASNGFRSDCDEVNDALPEVEVPTSSLTIRLVDHGETDSAADMKDPASDPAIEKVSSPALAEVAEVNLNDSSESSTAEADDTNPVSDLPETALKLPGVAEKDQPRFRRQMYRTDI
jgi:hypothetical protein